MKKALLVLAVGALLAACNCSVNSKNCGGKPGDACSQYMSQKGCKRCDMMVKRGFGDEGCGGQCNPWRNVAPKKVQPVVTAPAPIPVPAPVIAAAPAPAPKPAQISSDELGTVAAVKSTSTGQKISFNAPILFKTNSDKIETQSYGDIQKIATVLKNHPEAKTTVEGYTDNTGDPAYNVNLSQRRAQAVANQLVADGVNKANVSAKGYGAANPIADNKTAAGRLQNRRVELNIVNQ
ncbi:MAG: OmpA family protein [Elusimicrobium sp.]|jgi:outer membrane protein OmpA-like peptidoglycan-associated protein|nr:OmpA family protein [Elusimicrobium sp.]